jgi:hypothetical protein
MSGERARGDTSMWGVSGHAPCRVGGAEPCDAWVKVTHAMTAEQDDAGPVDRARLVVYYGQLPDSPVLGTCPALPRMWACRVRIAQRAPVSAAMATPARFSRKVWSRLVRWGSCSVGDRRATCHPASEPCLMHFVSKITARRWHLLVASASACSRPEAGEVRGGVARFRVGGGRHLRMGGFGGMSW